jgi:hypothetical protein
VEDRDERHQRRKVRILCDVYGYLVRVQIIDDKSWPEMTSRSWPGPVIPELGRYWYLCDCAVRGERMSRFPLCVVVAILVMRCAAVLSGSTGQAVAGDHTLRRQ